MAYLKYSAWPKLSYYTFINHKQNNSGLRYKLPNNTLHFAVYVTKIYTQPEHVLGYLHERNNCL